MISYFRLVVNPHDEEAFKRVINYPARGIGDTTIQKLTTAATTHQLSLWQVLQTPLEYGVNINKGTAGKLAAFRDMLTAFIDKLGTLPADELALFIARESGIIHLLSQDRSTEGISKLENLQELLKGMVEFCEIL